MLHQTAGLWKRRRRARFLHYGTRSLTRVAVDLVHRLSASGPSSLGDRLAALGVARDGDAGSGDRPEREHGEPGLRPLILPGA